MNNSQLVGHYQGFLLKNVNSQETQQTISADITTNSDQTLNLKIQSSRESDFAVSFKKDGAITLASQSDLLDGSIEFKKSSGNCLTSDAKDQLCLNGKEIRLELLNGGVKIVLDQLSPTTSTPTAMEEPKNYTLDELIARARDQSFASQVSFESLVQAKLTAEQNYLNLLPHINVNVALNVTSGSVMTMVRSIGDLLPFFLPDRWYLAAATENNSRATDYAYRIVQAGAINTVQGLGYSYLRDEQSLATLEKNEQQIVQIRDEILAQEQSGAGDIQIGSSDEINAVLNAIDHSEEALRLSMAQELASLSQSAGFINPNAVSGLTRIDLPVISGPLPGELSDIEKLAKARSLQLFQADELIEEAKNTKTATELEWLDPTGLDQDSLGFGTVDTIKLGDSMIAQLYKTKNQTESLLYSQVSTTLSQSQSVYNNLVLDIEASTINQHRVDRLLLDYKTVINFDMSDLANALAAKAMSDLAQVTDIYAYATVSAEMDFLTFNGVYAGLIPKAVSKF